MIIGLIVLFIIAIIIGLPYILKTNKPKRTAIVYSCLIVIGFVMSLLQIIDKMPPSPVILIEKIVKGVFY
ncbi:hypothetical protein [Dethiothermospora halolimnae]|uniref:hypothetical protein n=1 Tax=Dethiothermospora halolimnae TaxID=3114390 RepID=UPI003CCC2B7C